MRGKTTSVCEPNEKGSIFSTAAVICLVLAKFFIGHLTAQLRVV
jgi:hypothetical protein